jgi:hypothetical protein
MKKLTESNLVEKIVKRILTERQYKRILKEGMYIDDKGELMDDSDDKPVDIPNGTEIVDVLIYVGTNEFVFPGHYGEAAVLKWFGDTDEEGEGVIIRETLEEEGSVETLHMKGKLEWNDKYDIHNFYPYYPKEEIEEANKRNLGLIKEDLGKSYNAIKEALRTIKENPKQHSIENISKELDNQTYVILGLSPFQALKGYIIKKISMNVWGLFDKRVRDKEVAQLTVNEKKEIVDFKMKQ